MLRLTIVGVAAVAAAVCALQAWRMPARARLRAVRPSAARRLPARVREPLARALRDAQVPVSPEEALGLAGTAAVVAALLSASLHPGLVPIAIAGVLGAAPIGLVMARGRAQRRFVAALPAFVEVTAARLRSGHTVATALVEAGERADPVAPDVRRMVQRVDHGDALPAALAWWAEERRLDPVRAVAGSLAVAAETGGAAAAALDGLARSLRDLLGARADAAALSAQARMSAIVVGAAPLGYLAFSAAVDPRAASALVASNAGRVCLVLGLGLDALGALWMRRIVRSEP